jgi:glycosyltransferase involved in cell wall biosynthesis
MNTIVFPVNALGIAGAEQQLLALVRGLDKNRYRPIIAPLYSGWAGEEVFHQAPDVEIVSLHRKGKYDPSPLAKMTALLRSRQADIVQPFLTPATFFGLLPALLVGTPIKIVTERCGVRLTRGVGNQMYRLMEDYLTRFANIAVANSEAGRQDLMRRGIPAAKTHVIYNGLNPERLRSDPARVAEHRARLGVPEDGAVVGILATLTPAKDHANFLRAAAALSQRHPGMRFAIVGDGPLRPKLEQLAGELGLSDNVVFFGFQTRVADCLAACDFLVSSSRDNEGTSNSILEAMALNIPVVATDVGGTRELVVDGRTGYLVPAADHAAIAAAIESALTHPEEAHAIAARARQMIESRFSLESMVSQYDALYERLLATVPRSSRSARYDLGLDGVGIQE